MFEIVDPDTKNAVIKVVGVGGGGGNAVQHMIDRNVEGVEFIAANTDAQALRNLDAKTTLHIGASITKGLGAGANPEVGRQAAHEDRDRIIEVLTGADMVFITAGMGGGTGTGAAPVFAQIAKDLGILTVAVVTRPFRFERRDKAAERGVQELAAIVDSLITIPNERLLAVLGERTTMLDAFGAANNVLQGAVQGIADLIIRPGVINVDFADVRTVMREMGLAMMGTGRAKGDNRARDAAENAIRSPLLDDINLQGARGILVNITAGPDLNIGEFTQVGNIIDEFASDNATVVVGTSIDPEIGDEIKVTVVATGLGEPRAAASVVVDNTTSGSRQIAAQHTTDYNQLDRQPAYQRSGRVPSSQRDKAAGGELNQDDLDYLNVPAFLRRQAN